MKKVLLLLAEGFEIFEASVFIDVIGWNYLEGDRSTKLLTCGLNKQIKSSFDQQFIVDFTLDQIQVNDFAALAVPGGFEEYGFYRDAFSEEFSKLISDFHSQNKPIFSICTGAFPLAKSGVLKNKEATTYNLNLVRQKMLAELGAKIVNKPIVRSGNLTTSWNPSTAMNVAFELLEVLTTKENTQKIKSLMGFN